MVAVWDPLVRYEAEGLSGVAPGRYQDLPFYNTLIEVELQNSYCYLPFRCKRLYDRSLKEKMILPTVPPRVE